MVFPSIEIMFLGIALTRKLKKQPARLQKQSQFCGKTADLATLIQAGGLEQVGEKLCRM